MPSDGVVKAARLKMLLNLHYDNKVTWLHYVIIFLPKCGFCFALDSQGVGNVKVLILTFEINIDILF